MRKNQKALYIIIFATLVILAGALSTAMFKKEDTWIKIETKKGQQSFTVSGTVESLNKVEIISPFAAKIFKINVIEGQRVSNGQVIASFDKSSFNAQIEQLMAIREQATQNYTKYLSGNREEEINYSKAGYDSASKLLAQKKLELEKILKDEPRYNALYEKKMLTAQEYENYIKDLQIAKNAVDIQKSAVYSAINQYKLLKKGFRKEDIAYAKAEINKVNAQINELETTYKKTSITAPIAGHITAKFVDAGQEVMQGDKLFSISGNSQLEIKALIEEEDIDNIKIGDIVELKADAYPDINFKGKVINIIPSVDSSVKLIPVKVIPEENNLRLLPGMTISCTFPGKNVDHLAIQKNAIQYEGKKAFLETKNGKVYILPGPTFDNLVIIKGNIDKNEMVLLK